MFYIQYWRNTALIKLRKFCARPPARGNNDQVILTITLQILLNLTLPYIRKLYLPNWKSQWIGADNCSMNLASLNVKDVNSCSWLRHMTVLSLFTRILQSLLIFLQIFQIRIICTHTWISCVLPFYQERASVWTDKENPDQ